MTHRIEENSDGADISPSEARVRSEAADSANADEDLLAVDDRPGEVQGGQVDPAPGTARGLERVDDPRAGGQHGDAGAAHLAGDVDDEIGRRSRGRHVCGAEGSQRRRGGADGHRHHLRLVAHRPPGGQPDRERGHDHDDRQVDRAQLEATDPQPPRRMPPRHRQHHGRRPARRRVHRLTDPRVGGVVRLTPYGGELGTQRRQPPRHRLGVLGGRLGSAHPATLGTSRPLPTGVRANLWREVRQSSAGRPRGDAHRDHARPHVGAEDRPTQPREDLTVLRARPRVVPRGALPAARPGRGWRGARPLTSTSASPAASTASSSSLESALAEGAHLLDEAHPPLVHPQDRLHGERRADQRRRSTHPASAAEVFQGVDVERATSSPRPGRVLPHRRVRRVGTLVRRVPQQRAPRSRCPCPPDACRPRVTGTGDPPALRAGADSKVPLSSAEMCTETISVAPWAAAFS